MVKSGFDWLKEHMWDAIGIVSVALLIALFAFLLAPVGVSIDVWGYLSVGIDYAHAAPDFPTVEATNTNGVGADPVTVNLPADIQAGELLIAIVEFSLSSGFSATWPAGWTEIFTPKEQSDSRLEARYKVADGEEGASFTIDMDQARFGYSITFRISGYTGTPEGDTASNWGSEPDPPNLTPSWGEADTLWLAAYGGAHCLDTGGYPADYSNGLEDCDSGKRGVAKAERELKASSENPGTFTVVADTNWVAATIAVQPAAACSPDISNTPDSWSVNSGDPLLAGSNYSTGLTYFTVTNSSGGPVDISIYGTDMAGGGYTWDLADDGSPGDMTYALKAGLSGGDYTIIVRETEPYNILVSALGNGLTQDWGLRFWAPTVFDEDDNNGKSGSVIIEAECS